MTSNKICRVFLVLLLAVLVACSRRVPSEQIAGTYIAKYPFGTAELVLNRDGSFVQTVFLDHQGTATAHGSWQFDNFRSTITLHGAMPIVDGLGHLQNNWNATDDLPEEPVERLWLRIAIELSSEYPYIRQ